MYSALSYTLYLLLERDGEVTKKKFEEIVTETIPTLYGVEIYRNLEEVEGVFLKTANNLLNRGCEVKGGERILLEESCGEYVESNIRRIRALADTLGNPFKFYIDVVERALKP